MKDWKGMVYQDGFAYAEINGEIYEKKLGNIAYISGRINGDDNYKKKFARVKRQLERKGYCVLNPAEEPDGLSYDEYMERALLNVDRSDLVYFMPDWILSNGCAEEFETAFRHDKEISFIKPSKAWKVIAWLLSFYTASKIKRIIVAKTLEHRWQR